MAFPNPRLTPSSVFPGQIVGDPFYFNDFLTMGNLTAGLGFVQDADTASWKVTDDANSTFSIKDDEPGGVLLITTGSSTNDFSSSQHVGDAWEVALEKDIYFECRVKFSDTNDTQWFIGLATEDVTGTTLGPILDSFGSENSHVGFAQDSDTAVDIDCTVQNDGTQTISDTGINLVDDTFVTLAFHVHSSQEVHFYVNGARTNITKINLPVADEMTLSMEVHSPTASSTMEVDYIFCSAVR